MASEAAQQDRQENLFKRLGKRLIYSKHMLWGIGLASFLEAIIIPIPLETILIPLMQARRERLLQITLITLGACIAAAMVGYAAGFYLFDALGDQIIQWVSSPEQFENIKQQMDEKGFWFVVSVGVTPVPFQVAMLAAGATQFSFVAFVLATTLSRSIRYFGLALLVYYTGNKAEWLFHRHKLTVTTIIVCIVAAVWLVALL